MSVKLLMNWDIRPGHDQDYFEFVIREWLPGVNNLGIRPTWAWYTIYSRGRTPQIMAEAVADDFPTMRRALLSEEWGKLHTRLLEYVHNYSQKIVRVTGDFQL